MCYTNSPPRERPPVTKYLAANATSAARNNRGASLVKRCHRQQEIPTFKRNFIKDASRPKLGEVRRGGARHRTQSSGRLALSDAQEDQSRYRLSMRQNDKHKMTKQRIHRLSSIRTRRRNFRAYKRLQVSEPSASLTKKHREIYHLIHSDSLSRPVTDLIGSQGASPGSGAKKPLSGKSGPKRGQKGPLPGSLKRQKPSWIISFTCLLLSN